MTDGSTSGLRAAFRRVFASNAARLFLAAGGVAVCVALAHVFGLTLCPLKRWLGVPCPTCGTTRAAVLLLHGDVCGAFELQPLAMGAVCLLAPAALAVRLALGARRTKAFLAVAARRPAFWCIVAAAVLANWVYVIVHGN